MDTESAKFSEAFERWNDELFRHASMRLSDRERALDLTQECFMKAFDYVRKGNSIDDLRPFLYRTLRHLIIDEYRKHKAVSLEAMAAKAEIGVEDLLPHDDSNTVERALVRFESQAVVEALKELPEPYREAVTLRYMDGLTPGEIAGVIEESENVVSVRVHRGLKKLREMLEEKV